MAGRNASSFKFIFIFLGIILVFIIAGLTILDFKYKPAVDKFAFILRPSNIKQIENTKFPVKKLPIPNAFDYYNKAAKSLNPRGIEKSYSNKPANINSIDCFTLPIAEIKHSININQKAISLLRNGLKYDYMSPSATFDDKFDYLDEYRDLIRLLRNESILFESEGNYSKAIQNRIECIKFGVQIPKGGGVILTLVGISCQAIACNRIPSLLNNVDAKTAKSAIKQLIEIDNSSVSLADIIQDESNSTKLFIIKQMKSNKKMRDSDDSKNPANPNGIAFLNKLYANGFLSIDDYCKKEKTEANKPYPLRKKIETPTDYIGNIFSPSFDTLGFKFSFIETYRKLLILELALRAYYLDYKKYPDNLSQLCPKYLSKLPKDPFTVNEDFKYKKTGSDYIVYSIGPDFKDDNGKPFSKDSKEKKVMPKPDSKGDILFGMTD